MIERVFENAKLNKADKVCSYYMVYILRFNVYLSSGFGYLTFFFPKFSSLQLLVGLLKMQTTYMTYTPRWLHFCINKGFTQFLLLRMEQRLSDRHKTSSQTLHHHIMSQISFLTKHSAVSAIHQTLHLFASKHSPAEERRLGTNLLFLGLYPFVIVQDFGFFTAFFVPLGELATNIAGPLFARDVERLDRQDDRAAARTFSAKSLDFQMEEQPDQHGLSIYLFVLGELVDAWHNRNISHVQRAKMVIRLRFFLMGWRAYIVAHPDYSVNVQFISCESFDIFITLADSLLSLIIVYRKYYPRYPFLPWLHPTEACEHVFGVLRQIKKDFTFNDFLSAQPKLQALLLGAFGDLSTEEQANQTTAGYHHTYFTADDLDLKELLRYPSDQDLADASDATFKEAEQLLSSIRINAQQMMKTYVHPEKTYKSKPPPSSSRGPQTLEQVLALYVSPAASKAIDKAEAHNHEMALVAENIDRSLAL